MVLTNLTLPQLNLIEGNGVQQSQTSVAMSKLILTFSNRGISFKIQSCNNENVVRQYFLVQRAAHPNFVHFLTLLPHYVKLGACPLKCT